MLPPVQVVVNRYTGFQRKIRLKAQTFKVKALKMLQCDDVCKALTRDAAPVKVNVLKLLQSSNACNGHVCDTVAVAEVKALKIRQ